VFWGGGERQEVNPIILSTDLYVPYGRMALVRRISLWYIVSKMKVELTTYWYVNFFSVNTIYGHEHRLKRPSYK
jgi:hypothetical protein